MANPLLIPPGITKEQWGFEQCKMGSGVGMGGGCHFRMMGAVPLPGGGIQRPRAFGVSRVRH